MTKATLILVIFFMVACAAKGDGNRKVDPNSDAKTSDSQTVAVPSSNVSSNPNTAGSSSTATPSSCATVTCSGHGSCVEQVKVLSCECESGFYAKGTECLPHPSGDPNADAREGCKNLINRDRATLGLTALVRGTPEDEACADEEAKQDSNSQIMHGAFGLCNGSGDYWQNMCLLWSGGMAPTNPSPAWTGDPLIDTLDCLGALWGEGPGGAHYEEMIKPDIKIVDCGVYVDENKLATPIQNFR